MRAAGFLSQHPTVTKYQSWPLALHHQDCWPRGSYLARASHRGPDSKKTLPVTGVRGLTSAPCPGGRKLWEPWMLVLGTAHWLATSATENEQRACLHLAYVDTRPEAKDITHARTGPCSALFCNLMLSVCFQKNLEAQSPPDWIMIPRCQAMVSYGMNPSQLCLSYLSNTQDWLQLKALHHSLEIRK